MVAYPTPRSMLVRSGTGPTTRAFGELVAKTRRLPDAGISQNRSCCGCHCAPHGEPKSQGKQDEQSQKNAFLIGRVRQVGAILDLAYNPRQFYFQLNGRTSTMR
jgi:hypothetical protein